MDPSTPTPDDDRLLERLAAAGPVLDQLYRDVTQPSLEPAGRHGRRQDPRRVRHRRGGPGSRNRALGVVVAAVAVIAVGTAGVVALTSRDHRDRVVRADQPTTTTTPLTDAQLAELVQARVLGTQACGPMPRRDQVPITWPADWDMVGGYGPCITGYVQDGAGDKTVYPVYPTAEVTRPQAYWGPDTGWIPLDEYRDPGFDLERYRAAYVETRAQIAAAADGH